MNHSPGRARLLLALGFGGLLVILIGLAIYAARSLNQARAAASNSTREYLTRGQALGKLRDSAYAASRNMRDYLLDPDERGYARHRQAAEIAWNEARNSLARYRQNGGGEADALDRDLDAYWRAASESTALSAAQRKQLGYEMLVSKLTPLRDRFLQSIDELERSDQTALQQNIADTAAFLDALQLRLWLAIGFSLLLGAILALTAYRSLARLEAEAAARYAQSVEAAAQLEQLSHRLLAVQEDERKNLARELHDEVGQSVGALLVDLGQARKSKDAAETQARLQSAHELGERTLRNVRDICLLLRPSMLDDLGLIAALHWQARETSRRTGIAVSVNASGEDEDFELDDARRTAVYRVVQEALQNAARHSGAQTIEVALARAAGNLHILIRDNGRGFDPSRTSGLGLLGMQERIARLNGRVRIASGPGQGATLTIDLPLLHS